ncbi:TrkA family potassium uptake protein [candidate division WOR-3 bacterium]|nr:TrkA family potassium uptake protein [candidate division WOR-3 bacterium]
MKQFAVIGLGTFGQRVCRTLMAKGGEVIAVDKDAAKVEAVRDDVSRAICLDATDEDGLAHSGALDVDAVVVAMGEHMEEAILCTAVLKRLNAGYIVARAASELYGQILRQVGADRTVLIEEQMADQVAKSLVAPNMIEQIALSSGHSLVEMKPRREMLGKKLKEIDIRRRYQVNVVAIKKRVPVVSETGETEFQDRINDVPGPDDRIEQDDILVVVGPDEDIERLSRGR